MQATGQHLPVTVVEDGYLSRENLERAKKDEKWLEKVLSQHNCGIQDTFLLTVDESGQVVWLGKEIK